MSLFVIVSSTCMYSTVVQFCVYLHFPEAKRNGSSKIQVPFNRCSAHFPTVILCCSIFRYVVIKVELEDETRTGTVSFTDYSIYNGILKLVQKHYGDFGSAAVKSGLKCKYCNDQTRIAIIRIKHRPHRFVTSVLPLANVVRKCTIYSA